ncbi:glycosyltransferase [Fructobacillus fructosus KCTC 3544]|uniref:hypothetical protein n=1 Tax=Fructobacillus fructosus TaxID=1631 RepID=UPI0002195900|nr:hypothetical protein [Fructobacillus fructosus]KRN51804.1 glycosyltransferase [Fructobacillus fructosus KCTC 3544]
MKSISRKKLTFVLILFLVLLYISLLCYKITTVPNVFIDERTYMQEVQSLVYTGKDLNGLSFPVYFKGLFGNGQSVPYALMAVPFVKTFGFSTLTFRLPMILLNLSNILLVVSYTIKRQNLSLSMLVVFLTSPWIFISSRWVLDCNVAPIFFSMSLVFLALYIDLRKKYLLFLFCLMFAASVYGYIAGWLFLPLFFVAVSAYFYRNKILVLKELALMWVISLVLLFPLILFAFRLLVFKNSSVGHFLFISYPVMQMQRGESLITYHGLSHLFPDMLNNFMVGVSVYLRGSDSLPWNSVPGFGALFPPVLLLSLIGLVSNKSNLSEGLLTYKNIIKVAFFTYIPSLFIVIPTLNHWNFLNIVLVLLAGFGLYELYISLNAKVFTIIFVILIAIFSMFVSQYYFNNNSYFVKEFGNGHKYYKPMSEKETKKLQKDNIEKWVKQPINL